MLGPCRLGDSRVELAIEDVCDRVRGSESAWDAILIDTDNLAVGFHRKENDWIYKREGAMALARALRPGGTLAVWLTLKDDAFEKSLLFTGMSVRCVDVSRREEDAVIYIARRS